MLSISTLQTCTYGTFPASWMPRRQGSLRARLGAVDTIFGLVQQYDVRAILCAGDIFDTPQPHEDRLRFVCRFPALRSIWRLGINTCQDPAGEARPANGVIAGRPHESLGYDIRKQ